MATNIKDRNALENHLLPGLDAKGVPVGLKNTAIPFKYNDVEDFKRTVSMHSDARVICIEGARYDFPSDDFLNAIQKYALNNNVVIVSDEITSGWRMTDGGVYKINGFRPDIVVYGKALGGGYAISAVVGKQDIMDFAQDTFISSTMWTERIGFAAGIKTIEILKREKAWIHLNRIGALIGEGWFKLANKHNLSLKITEFKPLITFKLNYGEFNNQLLTLFAQEMLKRGYLSAPSIYVSLAHNEEIVSQYLEKVDEVFKILSDAIETKTIPQKLESKIRSDSFTRLT